MGRRGVRRRQGGEPIERRKVAEGRQGGEPVVCREGERRVERREGRSDWERVEGGKDGACARPAARDSIESNVSERGEEKGGEREAHQSMPSPESSCSTPTPPLVAGSTDQFDPLSSSLIPAAPPLTALGQLSKAASASHSSSATCGLAAAALSAPETTGDALSDHGDRWVSEHGKLWSCCAAGLLPRACAGGRTSGEGAAHGRADDVSNSVGAVGVASERL